MRRMPILDRNRFLRPLEDVLQRYRPVLVRISPGYPSVKGRLHTCYSPVRRSPAEESKLSSPLPLDLHVLSLSLAFILSQDQTLRCYLSFLFLFQKIRSDKYEINLLLSRKDVPHFPFGVMPSGLTVLYNAGLYRKSLFVWDGN